MAGTTSTTLPHLPTPTPRLGASTVLLDRLEDTRRELQRYHWIRAVLGSILLALLGLGLLTVLDWAWPLSFGVRALLLGGVVGLVGWRFLRERRSVHDLARGEAAAAVEGRFPQLGQRVCTTAEYAEPTPATAPAHPQFVTALSNDTARRTDGLPFQAIVPWSSLKRFWLGLGGLGLIALLILAFMPEMRTALLRSALIPLNYTQIQVEPGDQSLKLGEGLTIKTTITGRPVAKLTLQHRPSGTEEWMTQPILPPEAGGVRPKRLLGALETTLPSNQDGFDYQVVSNELRSPIYQVTILRPLVLKEVEATIQPPAYTRKDKLIVKDGNLKVIEGSTAQLQFTLDRAPAAATLKLTPSDDKSAESAMVPIQIDGSDLRAELPPLVQAAEYELAAVAADGMKLEPQRFRITVTPDRAPSISIVKPKEQIEVIPTTDVEIKLNAKDDFGLARVGIVYQVGNGAMKSLELAHDPKQPVKLDLLETLFLENHELTHQDSITYHAFVEDNHPTHPHRATTELQFIDIRPFKRAYEVLKNGGT
jgi:hypothetical protein